MDNVDALNNVVVMIFEIIFRQIADCKNTTSELPSAEEKSKVTTFYSLPNISAYEIFYISFFLCNTLHWQQTS